MSNVWQEMSSFRKAQSFLKTLPFAVVAGIQILESVDGVVDVLSIMSIHNVLSDKMRIYLLSMRLLPSQERKVKFAVQRKSTTNQLKLKLTMALNVM